jgi:hypothetical protein
MWIKSEGGQLLNLGHARLIEVFPSGDENYAVVAHFVGSERASEISGVQNPLFVTLTEPKPHKETLAQFTRLTGALEMKESYVDLSRTS